MGISAAYKAFGRWAVETALIVAVVAAHWLATDIGKLKTTPALIAVGIAAVPAAWLGRKAGPDFFTSWPDLNL